MAETVTPPEEQLGTREHAESHVRLAVQFLPLAERDCRHIARAVIQLKAARAWDTVFSDEPRTWERLALERIGADPKWLDAIARGVQRIIGWGIDGPPISAAMALAALDAVDRAQAAGASLGGRPAKGKPVNNGDGLIRPRGNSRQAALRALRAHRPDLHAHVLAGKLSPHAAMIEAGFRRRTLTVPADDAKLAVKKLIDHYGYELVAAAIDAY